MIVEGQADFIFIMHANQCRLLQIICGAFQRWQMLKVRMRL